MRFPMIAAFALSLAVPALAQQAANDSVYEHSQLGVRLTVHSLGAGYEPDGVTYEGAKGVFLLTRDELFDKFAKDVGELQTIYNIWDFTREGLRYRDCHRDYGTIWSWKTNEGVAQVEALIAKLGTDKLTAPEEARQRVARLRGRADRAMMKRSALLAAAKLQPGLVKDAAWLARIDSDILKTRAEADRAEKASTASDADRYVKAARILKAAEYEMWKHEQVLDWERTDQ